MFNFDTYLSPFTWRYGSQEMRQIWSEQHKRLMWRELWFNLAKVQAEFGLVNDAQLADLEQHVQQVDIERSLQIEGEIHHDLMAELKTYAEQCPVGGGILHIGATSMDIEDNADVLRIRQALDIIYLKIRKLLHIFAEKITEWAEIPVMGFTHLQPAEPTTLGYRMAFYAQDLLDGALAIKANLETLKGKGFKGAVGTGASYAELIGPENLALFEGRLSQYLDLDFFLITNQTVPRKQDYDVVCQLSGIGLVLNKFAFDLRFIQTPAYGELAEPFGKSQVGSSAMPFKRNPIQSEKINSLARSLAQMPALAWQNAAHSLLERTLDDSANRRTLIPEAFLICDELLMTSASILNGLKPNFEAIDRDLEIYAPFAGTERLLMALAKAGADRQEMHNRLRKASLAAWDSVQKSEPNPLIDLVSGDPVFSSYLPEDQIRILFEIETYLGDAPGRAQQQAEKINSFLSVEER
jgi:adenylosuccinate lyase